jgi:hypothetical protein
MAYGKKEMEVWLDRAVATLCLQPNGYLQKHDDNRPLPMNGNKRGA